MHEQGYNIEPYKARLEEMPDSYDEVYHLLEEMKHASIRATFPYVEPDSFSKIINACGLNSDAYKLKKYPIPSDVSERAKAAFYGAIQGCILGKPLEVNPTMDELRKAGVTVGEWPIKDYISEEFLQALGKRHLSAPFTTRNNIHYVAADDDLNYLIMALLNVETYGSQLSTGAVWRNWQKHIPLAYVFGAERFVAATIAVENIFGAEDFDDDILRTGEKCDFENYIFNPSQERCGAAIRTAAYGLAFPGQPIVASKLAYEDAFLTHRKTGLYAAMYIAAVTSLMPVFPNEPIRAFSEGLCVVPPQSRLHQAISYSILVIRGAKDFEDGYARVHARFNKYDHCMVYQEIGTLINSVVFASNIWEGVCMQVMQGNDTDSFGCIAGIILGTRFGLSEIDYEKIRVFEDVIHIALADFYETSIDRLARRFAALPTLHNCNDEQIYDM